MIYDYDYAINHRQDIIDKIDAEFKVIRVSTLGGRDNACIMLTLSLDKKDTWAFGILQNSRYYQISIDRLGVVENFTCGLKVKSIRKKTVKSLDEALEYINKKLGEQCN